MFDVRKFMKAICNVCISDISTCLRTYQETTNDEEYWDMLKKKHADSFPQYQPYESDIKFQEDPQTLYVPIYNFFNKNLAALPD